MPKELWLQFIYHIKKLYSNDSHKIWRIEAFIITILDIWNVCVILSSTSQVLSRDFI